MWESEIGGFVSLRYEQYWSLKQTKNFLYYLLNSTAKFTKKELRNRASMCLKHFPTLNEHGKPYFSLDGFTSEEGRRE